MRTYVAYIGRGEKIMVKGFNDPIKAHVFARTKPLSSVRRKREDAVNDVKEYLPDEA